MIGSIQLQVPEGYPQNVISYPIQKTKSHKEYTAYVYSLVKEVDWDVIAQAFSIQVTHYVPSISTRAHSKLEDTEVRYLEFESSIQVSASFPYAQALRERGTVEPELSEKCKTLLQQEALRVALQDLESYTGYMTASTRFVGCNTITQEEFCKLLNVKQSFLLEHNNSQGLLPSWKLFTSSVSGYEQLASTYDYALKKFAQENHPNGVSCLRGFDLAEAIKGLK